MALEIIAYRPEHEPAVAAFNARAIEHRAPFCLSKTAIAAWLPKVAGGRFYREFFLALDGGEVRGGFTLRRQEFLLRGKVTAVANYQGPLSEGIWDRRFMMAGVQMLRAALRDQPLLYALGMGGIDQPLPKLLATAGWSIALVPFHFKVLRASAFLRNIRPLRATPARARLMNLAAASGLGAAAVQAFQWLRTKRRRPADAGCTVVSDFGAWADDVWEKTRPVYSFTAIRDRTAQNILFGDGNPHNLLLRCTRSGADIGWAVVRSTQMRGDQYFGDMRLGSIVDCLAVPGEEFAVTALAIKHLRALASDLVVTNQMHSAWNLALREAGFLSTKSNFLLATSPQLTDALGGSDFSAAGLHFNRADGDGPIHL